MNKDNEILARGQLNLQANQQGKMSAQQKDWLQQDMKKERQKQYRLFFVSCAIFLMVAIVLVLLPSLPIPIIILPIILSMGLIAWGSFVWIQEKPIRNDIASGQVETLTGYVDKSTEQGYHITIGGVKYATHPDMYPAFDETLPYTIYVTPQSKIVLSAQIDL